MGAILQTETKMFRTKILIFVIYALLSLGGVTMVFPFLIMLSSSVTSGFDYNRFHVIPRSLYSRADRFVRGFQNGFRYGAPNYIFRAKPKRWRSIALIMDDYKNINTFAGHYLSIENDPSKLARWKVLAADYADFAMDYDIKDTFIEIDDRDIASYLREEYFARYLKAHPEEAKKNVHFGITDKALETLKQEWGIPFEDFFFIDMEREINFPLHHPSWDYPGTEKTKIFLKLKDAYRRLYFLGGARSKWSAFYKKNGFGNVAPWPVERTDAVNWLRFKKFVGQFAPNVLTVPFCLKTEWLGYFNRPEVKKEMGHKNDFTIADYNTAFQTSYGHLGDTPFPVPGDAHPRLKRIWRMFVLNRYPARLMRIKVTPALTRRYQKMLKKNFRNIRNFNMKLEKYSASFTNFSQVPLAPDGKTITIDGKKLNTWNFLPLWQNMLRTVPYSNLVLLSSEKAYQDYLLGKYKTLAAVNKAYGWDLKRIDQAVIPVAEAYTITFLNDHFMPYIRNAVKNYISVVEYLFVRGRAFLNTVILIVLTIAGSLTINPLCAYALSRFHLKNKEKILLFVLAVVAFPAAIRSIPGFLLMRDLGMLDTYAALILPGIANGMSIFILKGFFDGLPRELYEAATIDGASELQMFATITFPMMTPILAVNALNAFIHAYKSWQWALIVCQKQSMWTIAVWLYQMSQNWTHMPWLMMASFVVASIPTAIVFITCQKIILRGIVIPAMK